MSKLRTLAFLIQDRLEEITELAGNVVVYRRSDIESEFEMRMNKVRGLCVVVRLLSAQNDSGRKTSLFAGSYSITLFTVPVLTQHDAKDSDALMAEIEAKINGWWPASLQFTGTSWLKSGGITYPDDKSYDVSLLTVKSPILPLQ